MVLGWKGLNMKLSNNDVEHIMSLLPSGIPANEDTWCALKWLIENNEYVWKKWEENPPTEEEEIEIYRSLGRLQ